MITPVKTLGHRTDLALLTARGSTVEERGTHSVIRTVDNPAFRWGNFLQLRAVPSPDEAEHWRAQFASAFPGAGYVALGIDVPDATVDLDGWRAAGFEPETEVVLTADPATIALGGDAAALPMRAIVGDDDWEAVRRWAVVTDEVGEAEHDEFVRRRMASHRRAAESGTGAWFGAFDGPVMVAGLGLFVTADGDARYQHVATRSDWRRRGLATSLLGHAAADVGGWAPVRRLAIVADPEGPAIELYRRAGFVPTERLSQLEAGPDP